MSVDKLLERVKQIKQEREVEEMGEQERINAGLKDYLAEVREHIRAKEASAVGDGYDSLRAIYTLALQQASDGKGTERHSNGQPFEQQPICQGGRRFGVGCLIYQAWKKAHETPVLLGMDNGKERAVRELLGVINYAAAAIIVLQEGGE